MTVKTLLYIPIRVVDGVSCRMIWFVQALEHVHAHFERHIAERRVRSAAQMSSAEKSQSFDKVIGRKPD